MQDGIIQDHIDVYLSEATFTVVTRAFPFLVSKELATGGGDVSGPLLLVLVLFQSTYSRLLYYVGRRFIWSPVRSFGHGDH